MTLREALIEAIDRVLPRGAFHETAGYVDAVLAAVPDAALAAPAAEPREEGLRAVVKAEELRLATHADCHWHDYGEADEDGPAPRGKCVPVLEVIRSLNTILAAAQPGPSEAGLRPEIVVLCGSTRFYDDFQQANYDLTMAGRIVLSVGFYPHSKAVHGHGEGVGHDSAQKVALDELHKRKIDLADRVYVLNRDGYIGDSTRSEIEYAERSGKPVAYAFDVDGVRSTIDGWPCPRHDAALAHVGHHSCEKHS